MKKNLFLIIVVLMCSCSIFRPKGFEYKYDAQYTGIDTLINISGYYQTEYVPGESIMFYQDGLMCVTGSDPKERFDLFNEGSVSWGTYIISGDTIKAQFIAYFGLMDGGYYVSNDYHKIVSNNKIISVH